MTQEATPVGGETAPVESTNPADVFTQLAAEEFGVTDEEDQPEDAPAEGESAEEADDEPTLEEEADDLPPIDAPVSWDAEAKETFKNLPREAQEIVAKRESERERFVQQKSQEAAQAKQTAFQEAQQQLAAYDAQVAQQLQQYAQSITPQKPNPALMGYNPQAYAEQLDAYESAQAQQQQLQHQAMQYAQQAQVRAAQLEQANHAEQHRVIVENFPEYADPTTGPELQRKLTAVAKEMGFPDELIASARAVDILAMRTAADWKAKADKYDALQKDRMAKVRAAKGKPPVTARPGVAQTPGQSQARNIAQLNEALTSKNRDVAGEAFMKLIETKGW
jgi:hypothetical protein